MHTGEPELGDEGYVGMDVVVAARVCASAHGEQIVVTRRLGTLGRRSRSPARSYRPLGDHRLKDVPNAVQLFQLVAARAARRLPAAQDPHRRRASRRSITDSSDAGCARAGREPPRGWARATRHDHRPGRRRKEPTRSRGRGDARRSTGRCISSASPPSRMPSSSRARSRAPSACASRGSAGRARGGRRPTRRIGRPALPRQPRAPRPLGRHRCRRAPRSRAGSTGARDEPHTASPLDRSTSCRSSRFRSRRDDALRRARGRPRRDAATTTLLLPSTRSAGDSTACRSRSSSSPHGSLVLPPAEIVRALGEGLALEMEGPVDLPERQRTLRAAIDWSYQRLTESQRQLHGSARRVHRQGSARRCTCASQRLARRFLSDLEALVGWSLVRSESTDGEVRLSMLETVREHALGHLRADGASRRAAQAPCGALPRAGTQRGGASSRARTRRRGSTGSRRSYDNLGAALEWLLSVGRVEDALAAISALERFWRGHAPRARRAALALSGACAPRRHRT